MCQEQPLSYVRREVILRATPVFLVSWALLLAVTTTEANAQACTGRPGASAIEQYCEAIPDGDGERSTAAGESRDPERGANELPRSTAEALRNAGTEGRVILGLVGGAASENSMRGPGTDRSGTSSGASTAQGTGSGNMRRDADDVAPASAPSSNPLRAVRSAVTNGATIDSGFLWGVLAMTVVLVGAGWVGFRRNHSS